MPDDHAPLNQRGAATIRCRCIWQNVRCEKEATQEDGLCDWCAGFGARSEDQMRESPNALVSPVDGELLGLAGGTVTGYNHQAGWGDIPDTVRPTACWFADSGRVLGRA